MRRPYGAHVVCYVMYCLMLYIIDMASFRHNVELPWVSSAREILLELIAAPAPTVRRAAAESMALMATKVS